MNHKLSQTDIETLLKCIENETEIPEDLLPKLNPSFFDKLAQENKFDYQKLEKYKIPTIEYAGKRSEALILSQAGLMGGGSPLQVERCFESNSQVDQVEGDDWKNLIVQGDNLQFLKTCYLNQDPLIKDKVKGKVKLIYIDPPFATKSDFKGKEGEFSYNDKIARSEFLEGLRERLIFLRDILSDDGGIFIHLDYRTVHYVKVTCDELFGKDNLVNEIVYGYRIQGISASSYARKHQTILWYSKKPYYPTLETERIWYEKQFRDTAFIKASGLSDDEKVNIIKSISKGETLNDKYKDKLFNKYYSDVRVRDVWDCDSTKPFISGSKEYIGYPTQKSEGLLYRIINNHTDKDDIVMDCFGGSGTTVAVAEKLGRRWIACDFGKHSIYTMQKRMLEIADSKKLGKDVKNGEKYGQPAKPFCVASVGAYDFQRIMNLRENKSAYIDFVLSLFGVTDRAPITEGEYTDEYAHKFKVANVYAQKDGNPVEVYPIWEDDYLKNIKIDEEYLEGIIAQAGGKLRGPYYIIAPETCDVVGDTKIGETEFNILSFPYKILEEASRNFQLTEQPSSADNINDLVSSVGFYFNEEVDVGAERHKQGIQITRFVTSILNAEGNHYDGLDGLAMILLDKDYDGNTFRIEEAIYHKDISEEGVCKVSGLTDSVALIAVDKHGNESKLLTI